VGSEESRRDAAVAGHRDDEPTARRLLDDPDPGVRETALGALDRMGRLRGDDLERAAADPAVGVRRRAVELVPRLPEAPMRLTELLDDPEPAVVEMAAWALGERRPPEAGGVAALARVAGEHPDPLCREAAVAALGALGDPLGLPAVLAALDDKATVRRRAVIALAPFEGPDVDGALERALTDRDRQVRQAAEDLLSDRS
jgi:HEAT repeat protein